MDKLISYKEIAFMLQVSYDTVRSWRSDNYKDFPLPDQYIGRPRWYESTIKNWAAQITQGRVENEIN